MFSSLYEWWSRISERKGFYKRGWFRLRISDVFVCWNECNMGNFQFITGFWFFPPGFRFYPVYFSSICGLTLPRTQIRELWEFFIRHWMSIVYVWGIFLRPAISTIRACDMGHIRGWNGPNHALIWTESDHETGIIGMSFELSGTTLRGIWNCSTVWNGLYNTGLDVAVHLFCDFILSK